MKKQEIAKKMDTDVSYPKETLVHHWGTGKPMKHEGQKYRVGRMSYGDYFLEPHGKGGGERQPFARGTHWLEKHPDKKEHYRINKAYE
jgi:hypothetical protein